MIAEQSTNNCTDIQFDFIGDEIRWSHASSIDKKTPTNGDSTTKAGILFQSRQIRKQNAVIAEKQRKSHLIGVWGLIESLNNGLERF